MKAVATHAMTGMPNSSTSQLGVTNIGNRGLLLGSLNPNNISSIESFRGAPNIRVSIIIICHS